MNNKLCERCLAIEFNKKLLKENIDLEIIKSLNKTNKYYLKCCVICINKELITNDIR